MELQIKSYKKTFEHGYSFGVFPTIELIENRKSEVLKVLFMRKGLENEGIKEIIGLCERYGIPAEVDDKSINRISKKENNYTVGVFKKYRDRVLEGNHLVLVNPSDMGNLGTIIRTALGFNIRDIAIIKPGVDIFDPKVVRASMGAIFKMRIEYFECFEDYSKRFSKNNCYTFMLNADYYLEDIMDLKEKPYSLIFGNEGSGLDEERFKDVGRSVKIRQSEYIDSLNLSIAVGISLYEFGK